MGDALERARSGALYGVLFSFVYDIYAVGLFFVSGAEPFKRDGITLGTAIVAYTIGGIAAGSIVGALMPLSRSRVGAAFVYSVAAFFVWVTIASASDGIRNINWLLCGILAVITGVVGAFAWRNLLG